MYALITAARNEESYIEKTLCAVEAQTVRPARWVVVSDGSTDRTEEIVRGHAARSPWIELVRAESGGARSFGSKARAVNSAWRRLNASPWEYLGILDADVSFGAHYYAALLPEFERDPRLGVGGGRVLDAWRGGFVRRPMSEKWSVRGPVQTFRRACFEQIQGYRELTYGGIDCLAETMARMYGWRVRTFPEVTAYHHRPTGAEAHGALRARFRLGRQNYVIGYHPLFVLARSVPAAAQPPCVAGALAVLAGYFSGALRREPRQAPPEVARFLRREQIDRLLRRRASQ
ncbi:MAG: glycosyltransferase [Lentisphaerae bacterium]|nr:glycosyltransferase [Lentisphaerota bacterium]